MKRKFLTAGVILLLLFLLFFPGEALAATKSGMKLWLNTLMPTLLPFIILTGVLVHTDGIKKIMSPAEPLFKHILGLSSYGGYVFLLGLLCGYPMGAKLASDLYTERKISRTEAHYLTTFSNNASPAFIISYLGHACLKDRILPHTLFLCFLISDLMCMLFFRFIVYKNRTIGIISDEKKETSQVLSSGTILDVSIMNGFEAIARLGGYILLFSILAACVSHFWPFSPHLKYIPLSYLEVTTGLSLISVCDLPFTVKCILSVTATAFGGICILAQTRSILNKDLHILPYFLSKCMNGILTGILFCLLILTKVI